MTNEPKATQEVMTRFQPSNLCRVIHVDGAWGGVTPQLLVHMAVFSEYKAFGIGSTVRIDAGGAQDIPEPDPGYVTREIEADLMMNEQCAIAIRDWLSLRINEIQTFRLGIAKKQE